jgi:HD-GYP domain-containing protein (c-di-GMP phosphodiesterase class II)/DNA-binding CsgD family transcriptional regulator
MTQVRSGSVRLAELVASLSLATDLGMGQPMEQALKTCLLAMNAAKAAGTPGPESVDVYYLALLRFVGCTADAHEAARAVGGDEIADRQRLAPVVMGGMADAMKHILLRHAAGTPPLTRVKLVAGALAEGSDAASRQIASHCEVARMLTARMALPESIGIGVGLTFEHWDGKGLPGALAGKGIPLAVRIVSLARDVEVFGRLGGWEMVKDVLAHRRGKSYDPELADAFLAEGRPWLDAVDSAPVWDAVLAAEPAPWRWIGEEALDGVLEAFADFADLKLPFTLGHSRRVSALAATAAEQAGLPAEDVTDLRRAGLVHDLGKVGVPNGTLEKTAPLSPAEHEQIRLHPYLTERILTYTPALARIANLAGSHHEQVDGSGYFRGSSGAALSTAARILAAANTYDSYLQGRPHRPAMEHKEAAAALRRQAEAGRIGHEAVQCVLAAVGVRVPATRRQWPKGLTDREVEVLRLVSRGASKKEVAELLVVSPKTVNRHVENIYSKIGVSSRASAALFAVENGLLDATLTP